MDIRLRLALAASFCLLPLVPLAIRLAKLQVMEHRDLESRASEEFSRNYEEIIPRADIVDRNGKILAQSILTWSCFLDKKMIRSPENMASKLAPFLKMPINEILGRYRLASRFVRFNVRLSYEEVLALGRLRLEGLGITATQDRFYPNGMLARNVLGEASADGRGRAGLELALDPMLTGKARKFKVIRDGSGRSIYRSSETTPRQAEPVRLTIDRNIQYYAEEILRENAAQFSIKRGLIAVQDPNNGEILAMAAYPENPQNNPIVQDTFEPGSTFKVVTAAAALDEALVKTDETFFCENGAFQIAPGVVIHDHEPQGDLTLSGILENSSNIGIAKVADRLGAMRFYRYARSFGFASKTGIRLPGETSGEMRPLSDMSKVGLAASSYGYGIGVSPLQLLGAYSAIANGGTLWEPSLVKEEGSQPVRVRRVATPSTMATLADILERVVERGTGMLAQIPGYRAAGKTGTARRIDPLTHKYSTSRYNASFAGFLPAARPQWTILVIIEDPKGQYYGAQVAAPVFAKLGRQLLALNGVRPDAPSAARLARR